MRKFIPTSRWNYGEQQVKEKGTDRTYTLTQPEELFSEDYYIVRRCIAVENVDMHTIPEKDFYVYEFSFMTTGSSARMIAIDEETALDLVHAHLKEFMQGKANSVLNMYFG